jgi:hypothetical protein
MKTKEENQNRFAWELQTHCPRVSAMTRRLAQQVAPKGPSNGRCSGLAKLSSRSEHASCTPRGGDL